MKCAWAVGVALIVFSTASSRTVAAQPKAPSKPVVAPKTKPLGETLTGQAKADYDAARVLVTDGDYTGARIKFQAAYDASKDPRLLWNMAASEKQLRHYATAIDLLKKYAADAGPLVPAKEKAEAIELIKTLEPFTVAVTLDVSEPGADVEVDDVAVGRSPLPAPLVIDIGQHKVRVHKEAFRDYVGSTSIGGSPQQTIAVKLEKEVHEGKLAVVVPQGATVLIDGKPVPTGPANEPTEVKLPSGGHTLRVTAPGMRVYEREVVVRDNETRAVEIRLEKEAEPERPKLRVAVGCGDSQPLGTDDGLTLYIDSSPVAAAASGGKKTWSTELGRNRVDYVEFPVESGPHRVMVRIAGCEPMEASVDVTPGEGAEIRGALRSDASFVVRGPAGNPDWGRIGVAVWLPSSIGRMHGVQTISGASGARPDYQQQAAGVLVQPGLTFRWFSLALDLGLATGSASPADGTTFTREQVVDGLADNKADINWTRVGARAGGRLPLSYAALNLGIGGGYDYLTVNKLPPGYQWAHPQHAYVGAWSSLDVQVLCDWVAFGGAQLDGYLDELTQIRDVVYSLQFGVAFQPNRVCRTERSTEYGLRGSSTTK